MMTSQWKWSCSLDSRTTRQRGSWRSHTGDRVYWPALVYCDWANEFGSVHVATCTALCAWSQRDCCGPLQTIVRSCRSSTPPGTWRIQWHLSRRSSAVRSSTATGLSSHSSRASRGRRLAPGHDPLCRCRQGHCRRCVGFFVCILFGKTDTNIYNPLNHFEFWQWLKPPKKIPS